MMLKAKLIIMAMEFTKKHKGKIVAVILGILLIPAIIVEAMNPFHGDERKDPYIQAYSNVQEKYDITNPSLSVDVIRAIENVIYLDISNRQVNEIQNNIESYYIKQVTKEIDECDDDGKNCKKNQKKIWVFKDKDEVLKDITKAFNLTKTQIEDVDIMLKYQGDTQTNNGEISDDVAITNGDFLVPFSHYTITAGTWYYPSSFGGGWHPGIDFAVPTGTKVKAPINLTKLTTTSDSGYGIHGAYAGQKGDDTYSFIFAHNSRMSKDSTFKQGEMVAYSGNTGNSTGPHSHVEVFYFKNKTLKQVMSMYRKKGYWFGLGYNGTGDCNKVCRLKPEKVFGVKYGEVK